jgi:hypothetical protein
MSMPELSPLIAGNLACHECGTIMEPKVIMMKKGHKQVASHLEYECRNQETGCNYRVRTNHMTNSEMVGLREDGSEVMTR